MGKPNSARNVGETDKTDKNISHRISTIALGFGYKKRAETHRISSFNFVGVPGFEPGTPCSQSSQTIYVIS